MLALRQFGQSWKQRVRIMRRHRTFCAERSRATLGLWSWGCAGGCQLVRAAATATCCNTAVLRGRGRPCGRIDGMAPTELRAPLKSSETPRARLQARGSFPGSVRRYPCSGKNVADRLFLGWLGRQHASGQYVRRTSGVHVTQGPPFVPKALDRGVDSP